MKKSLVKLPLNPFLHCVSTGTQNPGFGDPFCHYELCYQVKVHFYETFNCTRAVFILNGMAAGPIIQFILNY